MRALLATQFSIVPHGGRYYTKSAFAAILRAVWRGPLAR